MSKKLILFFISTILFFPWHSAFAEVVINEVQLVPTSARFIELYNTGNSTVDLTNWLMQRKTATADTFGSLVSSTNFQGKTIGAQGYFLISRQQLSDSDVVVENLTLTESNTIQIKISGASDIINKIGWGDSSDCNADPCPSNPGEGQSIQRTSTGSWITATPTPKAANQNLPVSSISVGTGTLISNNSNNDNSFNQTAISTETKNKTTEEPKIKTKIIAKDTVFVGTPLSFQATATGYSKEKLLYGKYFWNFGDGDSKEVRVGSTEKLTHSYLYLGDYIVNLEYYLNSYSDTPDATDAMTVTVVPADIFISKIGDTQDFFVELSNNTDYDADISNWMLTSNVKTFAFPKNTVIGSKKKMTISSVFTHFSLSDKDTLKLVTSQNKIVFDYGTSLAPATTVQAPVLPKRAATPSLSRAAKLPQAVEPLEEPLEENLEASVIKSDISEDVSNNSYMPMLASGVFIAASAGAVYFIRKRKSVFSAGDDFKILDK